MKLRTLRSICKYYHDNHSKLVFMRVGYSAYLNMTPDKLRSNKQFNRILREMEGPDYLQAYRVLTNMYVLFKLNLIRNISTFRYFLSELWKHEQDSNYFSCLKPLLKEPTLVWEWYKEFLQETRQNEQNIITQFKFITQLLQDERLESNHPLARPL